MISGVRSIISNRGVAGFGVAMLVVACSAAGPPSSAPFPSSAVAKASEAPASASRAPAGASVAPASPSSGASASGMRQIVGKVLGKGPFPGFRVDVPVGWSTGDGHFVIKDGAAVVGLSVWDVVQVPTDPCHWKGHLVDPDPGVDGLVRALVGQATRNATTPTDVTLAGHAGTYLEWSVPAAMVVTGDADFKGCDHWPDGTLGDFVSWLSSGGGERFQQVAGQVDRLWVLDVDGKRLLVDGTYSPDATAADRQELADVAASLRFEGP